MRISTPTRTEATGPAKRLTSLTGKRVFVAGHRGLVGSAIVRRLAREDCKVITVTRDQYDLRRQNAVENFYDEFHPEVVFLAAATVGGILANKTRPAEFAYDNMAIAVNVIEEARWAEVQKLVFLGSSCIYPRETEQPIPETALLTGALEPSNRAYAVAKIAGIELCRSYRQQYGCDFVSVMPPNVYGEGDHFSDAQGSHVMAALIRRIVEAKRAKADHITIWGTGTPVREFLHADDLADFLCRSATDYSSDSPVNVGPGVGVSIYDLALMVAHAAEWDGTILTDPSMPDGTPCKVMDVSKMHGLDWHPAITLRDGIKRVVDWYAAQC